MCDPFTAIAIAGTVASIGASIAGGVQQQAAAKANAKAATQAAAFDELRQRERAQKLLAQQRVGYAKGGVTLEGTPTEVLADTAADAEIDALAIRWGGASRAAAFKAQGQQALIGGVTGAAGALLTGVTSYGSQLLPASSPQLPRAQRLTQTGVPGVY